ncbi:hypothetical protein KXD93_16655 [Mucilaginibacter sp. BJC16-A38]|uniref:hypothetical protein n=1 Tax=Mucilaginibacter phenanthrenivorans TaxID=1234842 RepID=UPI00215761ED|nr:hypothetical protein [Mucilaginibacter phenanthrenivorans]MCR8559290.1 hypothetical protein [Mucilaginibacter phenanthrenivorans]
MEEQSNTTAKSKKTSKRSFFTNARLKLLGQIGTGLFITIVGGLALDKLSCKKTPDQNIQSSTSKISKVKDDHSNNVQNIYNGTVNINNRDTDAKRRLNVPVISQIPLRVITNYSELNSVISKNLNAILKNNTKDTVKLMFTYPPGASNESNGSAEYLPGKLTVYSSCGQIIIEKCHLPWVPELREDVVKAQVRRNIDSLVIGEIGYICKKLKECLNQYSSYR